MNLSTINKALKDGLSKAWVTLKRSVGNLNFKHRRILVSSIINALCITHSLTYTVRLNVQLDLYFSCHMWCYVGRQPLSLLLSLFHYPSTKRGRSLIAYPNQPYIA